LGPAPAVTVEISREVHGMAVAIRMADPSSQLARLPIYLEGLVRVAQVPQDQREVAAVGYAGVVARVGGPELPALAVVEAGHRLLMTGTGTRDLGTVDPRDARHEQRFHHDAGVAEPFVQRHSVGSQVQAQPQIAADDAPLPHAQHDPEQLLRIADPLA